MAIWWITIGLLSRLIIHAPDATPITTLALLAPQFFSLRQSLFIIIATLSTSDLLLHFLLHYPAFGSWNLFTYSGWCGITLLGACRVNCNRLGHFLFLNMGAAALFWLWTNMGTWLTTSLYSHTTFGLLQCYDAALPFLRNSIISAMCWGFLINFLYNFRLLILCFVGIFVRSSFTHL